MSEDTGKLQQHKKKGGNKLKNKRTMYLFLCSVCSNKKIIIQNKRKRINYEQSSPLLIGNKTSNIKGTHTFEAQTTRVSHECFLYTSHM